MGLCAHRHRPRPGGIGTVAPDEAQVELTLGLCAVLAGGGLVAYYFLARKVQN